MPVRLYISTVKGGTDVDVLMRMCGPPLPLLRVWVA